MRQIASEKLALILELKSNPIVLAACRKLGIPTSTYYRWRDQDTRFRKEADRSIRNGRRMVSDMAEVHVLKGVKHGDKTYVMWWLKTFSPAYKKQEKSVIEIRQKDAVPKAKPEKPSKWLQPTVPMTTDEDLEKADPKLAKHLERAVRGIFRRSKREEALERALRKANVSQQEIDALLQQVDEEEKKNEELNEMFRKKKS